MPALYAHSRFGAMVLPLLPAALQSVAEAYPQQFEIGLQGPDVFFFYRLYSNNALVACGNAIHQAPAGDFFAHAAAVVRKYGADSPQYAYLLGFLCHFVLDAACHPYIDHMAAELSVHHIEIEEEFEKYLLRLDGKNPFAEPLWKRIPTDAATVKAMYPFYRGREGVTATRLYHSLLYMCALKWLFTTPHRPKQQFVNFLLHLTGHFDSMKGHMNQRADNPLCGRTNDALAVFFEDALPQAQKMATELDACIRSAAPLPGRFHRNFL